MTESLIGNRHLNEYEVVAQSTYREERHGELGFWVVIMTDYERADVELPYSVWYVMNEEPIREITGKMKRCVNSVFCPTREDANEIFAQRMDTYGLMEAS